MMKLIWIFVLAALFMGCRGSDKATRRARVEGMAIGRQQAASVFSNLPGQPATAPITVHGMVRHKQILWSEGMTLSRAILTADYYDLRDPRAIYLVRGGQATLISPKEVLSQQNDPELKPGDIIDIRQ